MKWMLPALLLALAAGHAAGHGDDKPGDKARRPISAQEHPWGREGDPARATRTIEVDMNDAMRFDPGKLQVRAGDTVRFVVRNTGRLMHEMVLGTKEELEAHAEMMKKHPGMEHDEPYMAHVAPGGRQEITWTFTKAGTFMYGCLVPGHWESGMKGTIVVAAR